MSNTMFLTGPDGDAVSARCDADGRLITVAEAKAVYGWLVPALLCVNVAELGAIIALLIFR